MKVPWLLLQLVDSGLPTGGFAHSAGLEAAAHQGELAAPGALRRYLRDALWQAGHAGLPLVTSAHAGEPELSLVDARAEAFLVNHVANRASRTQGRAFIDTCARIFPVELTSLRENVRTRRLKQHVGPMVGASLRALGIDLESTQQTWLVLTLRGYLFAAVRLGLCGTHEAQRLQRELEGQLDEVLGACAELRLDELAQTAPLADLFGSMHDRLYSRLFQS